MAVAAGYTVVTTAGTHNHDFVRNLGATHVFDHKSPTVIQDVLSVLENGDVVFDAISVTSTQAICAEIAHNIGCNKFASLLPALPNEWNVEPVFGMFCTPLISPILATNMRDSQWFSSRTCEP